QANANSGKLQAFDSWLQLFALSYNIKAPLRRDFFAFFWNQAALFRLDAQRNINNLLRVAHLQIEFGHDVPTQALTGAILNVAAIGAQMPNNPTGPGAVAN